MAAPAQSGNRGDQTRRRFNHDLLLDDEDGKAAVMRWPKVGPLIVDGELAKEFLPHELIAKALKKRVQTVGSFAVVLMVAAILGEATHLWVGEHTPYQDALRFGAEISALLGIVCAVLASRFGPWRRVWLRNRYYTEVLRQWHFRRLLEGQAIDAACASQAAADQYKQARNASLGALVQQLRGSAGQKMDRLVDSGFDILGRIPAPHLPKDLDTRAQVLDAYRVLRLEHQVDFARYKLSVEDRSWVGVSSLALVELTQQLASATLVLALCISFARLFVEMEWAPLAAIALVILGVGVRAWRDGLALRQEQERYQEVLYRLELAISRWDAAKSDEGGFLIAEEVEELASEELRAFLRSHDRAQFLL
jgi:hypothetical protein